MVMEHDSLSDQERLRNLAEVRELRLYLKTVGDPIRLQILRQLSLSQEMSVTELAQVLRISQPLLSWHLGVLRRIALVSIRREGRLAWYSLDMAVLCSFRKRFATWIGDVQEDETDVEGREHG
jgi:DNA-binding transcriptional ArsR family regulator